MSYNLALLDAKEKNKVELDKQASYIVWKLKQAKAGPEEITRKLKSVRSEEEQEWFEQSVEKYKRVMGVA
ncbi:DUF3283 family protein [Vibrio tritonius]|uniref:DUF3283 family protein n=1 Tax=Vibrio tritonius TaxID=1435069 RepID=UPI00315D1309